MSAQVLLACGPSVHEPDAAAKSDQIPAAAAASAHTSSAALGTSQRYLTVALNIARGADVAIPRRTLSGAKAKEDDGDARMDEEAIFTAD
jgi:hypothetical protein